MISDRNASTGWAARLCGFIAVAALLAGCMTSQRAMFAASTATHPIETGRYRTFERENNTFKPSDLVEVRDGTDGAYDFVDADGKAVPISLHPIGNGRFVGQGREKDGFAYAVFAVGPEGVQIYAPDCDRQDKDRMIALGVEIHNHECKIDRVADPVAFFSTVDIGQATSKMQRE